MLHSSNGQNSGERLLLFSTSAPMSAYHFLEGQLEFLQDEGYRTALVTSNDGLVSEWASARGSQVFLAPLERDPSPFKDFLALLSIISIHRRSKPWCSIYGTPKASLLSALASWLTRTKYRVYLVHGLRFEGFTGFRRYALIMVETLICFLSTHVVCVSESVRTVMQGEVPHLSGKARVLGSGSPNGVDSDRFNLTSAWKKEEARRSYNIPAGAFVGLFVGRVNPDKGFPILGQLAKKIGETDGDDFLVVAGSAEGGKSIELEIQTIDEAPRALFIGSVNRVEDLYAAADYLILPTVREGLPTVVIEAGASGIPTIASRVTGCVDAIRVASAGILVDQTDVQSWFDVIQDVKARLSVGEFEASTIRSEVVSRYDRRLVWDNWLTFFDSLPGTISA